MVAPWKTMGKPWENHDLYGKSPFSIGKSTISGGFTLWQTNITMEHHNFL
jgi:hypothetical protein